MPKTSPHVLTSELLRGCVTAVGVSQLLGGAIVTGLGDRIAIAGMIHAEKNQDIEVENDETHWVGHDRRPQSVTKNETITIDGNRTESVDKDESIAIHQKRVAALQIAGVTSLGRLQLLGGQPVTNANDRRRISSVLPAILGG